jgi:hypothetical protein
LPDPSGNVDTGGDSLVSIALEEEISALSGLSKAELLTIWRERLKQPSPSHLNKPILGPLLAYRLQRVTGNRKESKWPYNRLSGNFHRSTSAETMTAILHEDPPAVSQLVQSVPPGLQRVMQRCLEKILNSASSPRRILLSLWKRCRIPVVLSPIVVPPPPAPGEERSSGRQA